MLKFDCKPIEKLYWKFPFISRIYLIVKLYQHAQTSMCLQKSAIWFSENEGEGGWNAVWNFSKNASVLVNGGFLNDGGYGVDGGGDDVNDENNSAIFQYNFSIGNNPQSIVVYCPHIRHIYSLWLVVATCWWPWTYIYINKWKFIQMDYVASLLL